MTDPIIYGSSFAAMDVSDPNDSNGRYVVEWKIYEVYGEDVSTGQLDFIKDDPQMPEPVSDINDATVYAEMSIKWDGCSHLWLADDQGYMHVCGYSNWRSWNECITDLFKRSRKKMGDIVMEGEWPDD